MLRLQCRGAGRSFAFLSLTRVIRETRRAKVHPGVSGVQHPRRVPTRQRLLARADTWTEDTLHDLGRDLRQARLGAGLSQREVGRLVGRSHGRVGAIERGRSLHASVALVARIALIVGLRVHLRAYPGDRPVRDAAHAALVRRFRARLHPDLGWRSEVPLARVGDHRSWDARLEGPAIETRVELETRLHDGQALQRRIEAKRRDDPRVDRILLVLAATRANRAALRAVESTLGGDYPLRSREVLAALGSGRDPGGDGIVLI